jgi:hypothetical protein
LLPHAGGGSLKCAARAARLQPLVAAAYPVTAMRFRCIAATKSRSKTLDTTCPATSSTQSSGSACKLVLVIAIVMLRSHTVAMAPHKDIFQHILFLHCCMPGFKGLPTCHVGSMQTTEACRSTSDSLHQHHKHVSQPMSAMYRCIKGLSGTM